MQRQQQQQQQKKKAVVAVQPSLRTSATTTAVERRYPESIPQAVDGGGSETEGSPDLDLTAHAAVIAASEAVWAEAEAWVDAEAAEEEAAWVSYLKLTGEAKNNQQQWKDQYCTVLYCSLKTY